MAFSLTGYSQLGVCCTILLLASISATSSAFVWPSRPSSVRQTSCFNNGKRMFASPNIPDNGSGLRMSKPGYENYFDEEEEEQKKEQPQEPSVAIDDRYDEGEDISPHHDYKLAKDAGKSLHPNCPLTELQIHKLLAARRRYQRSRQYEKADHVLQGLNRAGVFVHDKRKEWRADGLRSFGPPKYKRRGVNVQELSDSKLQEIIVMVEARSRAKKQRDFVQSDQLEAKLSQEYQVQVDDKRREWSFVSSTIMPYVPSPLAGPDDPTHTMDDAMKQNIQQRLQDRASARTSKEYAEADAIRDELLETHTGIVVDDRTREWKIITDWEDTSDPFVVEAHASQRSAFVQRQQQQQSRQRAMDDAENDNDTEDEDDDDEALQRELNTIFDVIEIASEDIITVQNDNDDALPAASAVATTSNTNDDNVYQDNNHDIDDDDDDEALLALSTLTVVALKEKLRTAGLPVTGRKADLVDRLRSSI